MKCNPEESLKRRIAAELTETLDTQRTTHELMTIDDKRNELRENAALHNNVNHPAHYSGKHECIEIMRIMFGDEAVKAFCRCNSFKYRFRAARKNGDEDIAKAEWYEEYLFNMEKGEKL